MFAATGTRKIAIETRSVSWSLQGIRRSLDRCCFTSFRIV